MNAFVEAGRLRSQGQSIKIKEPQGYVYRLYCSVRFQGKTKVDFVCRKHRSWKFNLIINLK